MTGWGGNAPLSERENDMAKKAVINFRVEENLKIKMEQVCRGMGLSMTTAFDLYCRKVVAEKRIPFELETKANRRQGVSCPCAEET